MIGRSFHLFLLTGLVLTGIGVFLILIVLPLLWLVKKVLRLS